MISYHSHKQKETFFDYSNIIELFDMQTISKSTIKPFPFAVLTTYELSSSTLIPYSSSKKRFQERTMFDNCLLEDLLAYK
jgi:hypothetical protein